MFYHPFKKTVKTKSGKTTKRWYYWWKDPITGIQHQKLIPNVSNQSEAYVFISKLPDPTNTQRKITVNEIASEMFLPDSEHVSRLNQLGKKLSNRTLTNYRGFLKEITKVFGDYFIEDLTIPLVNGYLMNLSEKSGSWKNSFLETLNHIYKEAPWHCKYPVIKPEFPRFARNSKKADIFTSDELTKFFDGNNWVYGVREYLLFYVMASCGLRLGEARGLRVKQFIADSHALVIDGFCERNGNRTNYNKKGSNEDQKLRVTLVPDDTMSMVMKYVDSHYLTENDFIFQRDDGRPLRQEYLESVFHKVLTKASINIAGRKLCPHSFRFTYVTRMRRNVDAETVQKMVGHSSVEMTEYYTRAAIPEMVAGLNTARQAVNMLFDKR